MDNFIQRLKDPSKRDLDRNKGFSDQRFSEAMKAAAEDEGVHEVPKTPGTDIIDPYGSQIKPKGVPVWNEVPKNEAEWAIYKGKHIHSEANPLGRHSHVKGGRPSGPHVHLPSNRVGSHNHNQNGYGTLDGSHVHLPGENLPSGGHEHVPENFA